MEQNTEPQQEEIDKLWAAEGESRIAAYEAGILESIPISEVFEELEIEGQRDRRKREHDQ